MSGRPPTNFIIEGQGSVVLALSLLKNKKKQEKAIMGWLLGLNGGAFRVREKYRFYIKKGANFFIA